MTGDIRLFDYQLGSVIAPDDTDIVVGVPEDELFDWIVYERRYDSSLAVDTETTGLGWGSDVRLVQFGDSKKGYAVDVSTAEGCSIVDRALWAYTGPIVFHNASFDIRQLEKLGLDPEPLWERAVNTHVLSHVHNPAASHKLDDLAASLLGVDQSHKKLFRAWMRKNGWTWATVPLSVLVPYGVQDTILTHLLYTYFCERLTESDWEVVGKEMQVARLGWEIENHGMRLDKGYALNLKYRWRQDLARDREWFEFQGVDPKEFPEDGHIIENPNATAQLVAALRGMGWEPQEYTPTGKIKLDKKILQSLSGKYELVDRLLEYKRRAKWLAAYVNNCLEQVDAEGYVHASYNTLGAKTGRMSCSSPPLQQLPKGGGGEIRRLFIASEGCTIASVDYSAIEFRLAGALSGERRIIDVYKDGGDWYQQVADELNISRFAAKTFVLAVLYGAGGKRISEALGIHFLEARKLVKSFWAEYPTLSGWVRFVTAEAEAGRPVTSGWGRVLSPHAPYAAANAVIQGTAAEVLKDGLLRLESAHLLRYVAAVVHDEVVLDIPVEDQFEIVTLVSETLNDYSFSCPLTTEGQIYGASWGAGYAVS